jgi:hypothetical protein
LGLQIQDRMGHAWIQSSFRQRGEERFDRYGRELDYARQLMAEKSGYATVQNNLTLNINLRIANVDSGEVVFPRSVDIRGNTEDVDAWIGLHGRQSFCGVYPLLASPQWLRRVGVPPIISAAAQSQSCAQMRFRIFRVTRIWGALFPTRIQEEADGAAPAN